MFLGLLKSLSWPKGHTDEDRDQRTKCIWNEGESNMPIAAVATVVSTIPDKDMMA